MPPVCLLCAPDALGSNAPRVFGVLVKRRMRFGVRGTQKCSPPAAARDAHVGPARIAGRTRGGRWNLSCARTTPPRELCATSPFGGEWVFWMCLGWASRPFGGSRACVGGAPATHLEPPSNTAITKRSGTSRESLVWDMFHFAPDLAHFFGPSRTAGGVACLEGSPPPPPTATHPSGLHSGAMQTKAHPCGPVVTTCSRLVVWSPGLH